MSCFEISNLTKKFSNNTGEILVLDNISLSIKKGEFICILGRSGCGKTTFLRCLSGFDNLTSGEVVCGNTKILKPQMKYAMVFQDFNQLLPWMTVKQNIMYPLRLKKVNKKEENERKAVEYLDMVDLREYANFYPLKLSGGMKQRTAIARALAMEPEIMFMDEPFSSVDSQTRTELHKELLKIWRRSKTTIIFVTHNIVEAIYLSTRILVLSDKPSKIKLDILNPVKGEKNPNASGYSELWELLNNSII